jgi:hypothetical protein
LEGQEVSFEAVYEFSSPHIHSPLVPGVRDLAGDSVISHAHSAMRISIFVYGPPFQQKVMLNFMRLRCVLKILT